MTPFRRTGIELSLVSTQLVSLVPSPEVAHISIVPRAFRYAFGVISLKPMAERGEVGEKKIGKNPGIVVSFTSPPVPGGVPTWQDLEIADALWIKMT